MNKERMQTWWVGGAAATAIVLAAAGLIALMALVETPALRSATVSETPWYVHLAQAEKDLNANDFGAATHHWRAAYASALGGRRWHGLVEVGDFYRRLGARAGFPEAATARARECYLAALVRARAGGSTDGVLEATEAFLELGDRDMVQRGLYIAREVAYRDVDPRAKDRVTMLDLRAARAVRRSE